MDGLSAEDDEAGRMGRFKRRFGKDEDDRISFEDLKGSPDETTTESNALLQAAKLNLGGKYKASKFDLDTGAGKKSGKKK